MDTEKEPSPEGLPEVQADELEPEETQGQRMIRLNLDRWLEWRAGCYD